MSKLFDQVNIGDVILKNRIALAPMTRISATEEGVPSEKMNSYYTSFAKGNFGLIITEGNYIDTKFSQTYFLQPGIALDSHVEGWKPIVDSVHNEGSKIFMQIQHAGGLSQGNRFEDTTLAPSAVQPKGEQLDFYFGNGQFQIPQAATLEDIKEVIDAFVTAALNAEKAGFDGVEIHGANGYFLDQFLTPYTNTRTDQYGGDIENRLRIYVEVIKAVKEKVGEKFVVGIRLSQGKVNDYLHKWKDEKEAETIFATIENAGVDYLHITEFDAVSQAFNDDLYQSEKPLPLAAIAKRVTKLPVLVNGQINDIQKADTILEQDIADLITIGKAALANHDFPEKLKNGDVLNDFDPQKTLRPTAELKNFEYDFK